MILVMEHEHKQRLMAEYPSDMRSKVVHVLDIPDNYRYMAPELIEEIVAAVDPIISRKLGQ